MLTDAAADAGGGDGAIMTPAAPHSSGVTMDFDDVMKIDMGTAEHD